MRKILVTGGTVFVSKYIASYYAEQGDEVYVLNRNHHPQPDKTILIEADRHNLGTVLKQYTFDAILDVTAYTGEDVTHLLDALGNLESAHTAEYVEVYQDINQREYFSFYDYEYRLDVSRQKEVIEQTILMEEGLKEAYLWYREHKDKVNRKGYIEYIDRCFK